MTGAVRLLGWAATAAFAVTVGWPETLTVATYNIENYVATDRMTENGYRKDYPKPEAQKRAVRSVIKSLDADVLVLQEMGPAAYLDELQRDLRHDGLDYSHAVLLMGADPDRHVALLSRKPVLSVVQHTDLAFDYFGQREKVKRGMLEMQFVTSAGKLTVFGVHLKSRFSDRTDDPLSAKRRIAEATAVRDVVLRRFPQPTTATFLILGDFNDDRASKAVQRLLKNGNTTIAQLLPAADSRGETWTHHYHKEDAYSRVDHVIVSPALAAFVRDGAARICDLPDVRHASDHRPVVVTLEFPDKKEGPVLQPAQGALANEK